MKDKLHNLVEPAQSAKRKILNFIESCKSYMWSLFAAVAVFVILTAIDYFYLDTCPDNARYILSAISQGLAAILALVFTITLVVAQITGRYTAMDKIIFRPETKIFMIIFGIGVVTPLLVLKIGFWQHGVNLSIAIALFCVFSLIPFIKGLNGVLKYDIGTRNLYEDIMEAIERECEATAELRIQDLNKICKGMVDEFREDRAIEVLYFLNKIGEKSVGKEFKIATYRAVLGIGNIIGYYGQLKGFEDRIIKSAVTKLRELGVKVAEKRWDDSVNTIIGDLTGIGEEAAKTAESEEGPRRIGVVNKRDIVRETVVGLWCLGAAAEQEHLPARVYTVIKSLRGIENEMLWDKSWNEFTMIKLGDDYVNKFYPHLKSSFEEFKKRYKN
ncbi:MAG: hypothetical protein SVM80_03725 [Halobacteriota archaeon]|nr:hypothetical protein [Halobacteriota archaeon]